MQIANAVEKLMKDYQVAGMSVAVIKDGELVHVDGYGLRNVAENLPMTKDTVMPIGSTTKTFTALALGMLVDEGKLDWDEPVKTYIPWLKLNTPIMTDHVTTRDLMCHRTGVPRYDLQVVYDVKEDKEAMVRSLQYLEPTADFRTKLQYSNQMVSLAGYLVDVLSGIPYEEFVKERIFKPLGMDSTAFEVEALANYPESSKGYVFANDFIEPPYMHLGAFRPAGGIVSSAADMAKYLQFQLGDGTVNGERLISEEALKEMHSHQMIGTPYFWEFEELQSAEYGLGWFVDIYRGKKMISHGGNTNGFSSQMELIPGEKFAMVALSNATSSFAVNALGNILADEALGVEEMPDWSARYQEIFANLMQGAMAGMTARAEAKIPDTTPTKAMEDYAGRYTHPGFGTMEFAMTEQGLMGTWNGLPAILMHYHYDSFDLMLPVLGQPVPAQFVIADNGTIAGIKVTIEPTPGVSQVYFARE